MSDDAKNNETVQHDMQKLFDAKENIATIALTKNGVVAYHFGDNGSIAINPLTCSSALKKMITLLQC